MDLKLVISLALCHLVWGRPQLDERTDLQEAISNLQLLNQLMIENTQAQQNPQKLSKPFAVSPHRIAGAAPNQPYLGQNQLMPKTLQGHKKIYSSDGPFSDIPSDAFKLEHRKEFRIDGSEGRVTKKDLSGNRHVLTHAHTEEANKVPENLIQTCLDYFRGRSQPKPSSLELIVNICSELLDTDSVDDFALDDEQRQKMYDFRADEGAMHHHHTADGSVECACCPHGRHVLDEQRNHDEGDARAESVLNEIFGLFKPVGHRREWMVVNSQNPDERLRTYVDMKKSS